MIALDEFDYHRRLAGTPGTALVLFFSPHCGTCRAVEQRLAASVPEGATLFRVDVQHATALARAFEVFHLPTLLLYHDGSYHARLECQVTPAALRQAITDALALPAQEEP